MAEDSWPTPGAPLPRDPLAGAPRRERILHARPGHPVYRWLLGAAAPLAALALCVALRQWLDPAWYFVFLGAVFGAAWYGGIGPGLLAAGLSFVLMHLFLVEPLGVISVRGAAERVRSGGFVVLCFAASYLSGALRSAYARAVASGQEALRLAEQLQEQAIELEQQTEEAQALNEELEEQVETSALLREELERTHTRLQAVFESMSDGVVVVDRAGVITLANPAARALLAGLSLPETGTRFDHPGFEASTLDGRPLETAEYPVAIAMRERREVPGVEIALRTAQGRRVIRVGAVPLDALPGSHDAVVATFTDVTEAYAAARAVSESERRFRMLADTAPVMMWLADVTGARTFFNRPWAEFVGRPPDALLGDGWAEDVHPDDLARCEAVYRDSFGARREFRMEYRVRRADGEYRWLLDTGVPRFDDDGEFAGFAGSVLDITERRESEEQLRLLAEAGAALASSLDYEETLRRVAELAVPVLGDVCVLDVVEDGTVRRAAAVSAEPGRQGAAEALLRFTPVLDGAGDAVAEVLRTGLPRVDNVVGNPAARSGDGEHARAFEALGVRAYLAVPLRTAGGIQGALLLCATTSGRRFDHADVGRAEELARRAAYAIENARLYARTAEANRAKADFMAVMSHELRTPLNAILGYTDLFLAGIPSVLPDPFVPQVERVAAAGRHLRDMIEEILTFTRLEAGREQVAPEPADAGGLARDAAAIAEPLAAGKGLEFRLEPPPEPLPLHTDARKVRQILLNLLGNAVKFTAHGQVMLSVAREGDGVHFRVADTGPGIDPKHHDRIFEPFWQADQGLVREHGGSGLGLSVARQLARLLGGDITFESTPGQGSVFTLRLPR